MKKWCEQREWVSSGPGRTRAANVAKATNIPTWMKDLGAPAPAELLLAIDGCCGGRVKLLVFFFPLRDVVLSMLTISGWPTPVHTLGTLIRLSGLL